MGAFILELEHQEDRDTNEDDKAGSEPDHPGRHRTHVWAFLQAALVIMNRPGMILVSNITLCFAVMHLLNFSFSVVLIFESYLLVMTQVEAFSSLVFVAVDVEAANAKLLHAHVVIRHSGFAIEHKLSSGVCHLGQRGLLTSIEVEGC